MHFVYFLKINLKKEGSTTSSEWSQYVIAWVLLQSDCPLMFDHTTDVIH